MPHAVNYRTSSARNAGTERRPSPIRNKEDAINRIVEAYRLAQLTDDTDFPGRTARARSIQKRIVLAAFEQGFLLGSVYLNISAKKMADAIEEAGGGVVPPRTIAYHMRALGDDARFFEWWNRNKKHNKRAKNLAGQMRLVTGEAPSRPFMDYPEVASELANELASEVAPINHRDTETDTASSGASLENGTANADTLSPPDHSPSPPPDSYNGARDGSAELANGPASELVESAMQLAERRGWAWDRGSVALAIAIAIEHLVSFDSIYAGILAMEGLWCEEGRTPASAPNILNRVARTDDEEKSMLAELDRRTRTRLPARG